MLPLKSFQTALSETQMLWGHRKSRRRHACIGCRNPLLMIVMNARVWLGWVDASVKSCGGDASVKSCGGDATLAHRQQREELREREELRRRRNNRTSTPLGVGIGPNWRRARYPAFRPTDYLFISTFQILLTLRMISNSRPQGGPKGSRGDPWGTLRHAEFEFDKVLECEF